MIALDTNALSLLFVPGATACRRGTSTPIKHAKERVEELMSEVSKSGSEQESVKRSSGTG